MRQRNRGVPGATARTAGRPRLLVSSAALLWGLQFALLNPALALLLVALYNATPADVGWVLAVYNAGGFVAALLVPAYADRVNNYLRPLLVCAGLTLALAGVLASTTSLPVAVIGLIALGGPAGVGVSLLFAHLKHSGAPRADVMKTRAVVSVAWVAGPPLATLIMGTLGNRAILLALAAVAVLNIATTAAMIRRKPQTSSATRRARRDRMTAGRRCPGPASPPSSSGSSPCRQPTAPPYPSWVCS